MLRKGLGISGVPLLYKILLGVGYIRGSLKYANMREGRWDTMQKLLKERKQPNNFVDGPPVSK